MEFITTQKGGEALIWHGCKFTSASYHLTHSNKKTLSLKADGRKHCQENSSRDIYNQFFMCKKGEATEVTILQLQAGGLHKAKRRKVIQREEKIKLMKDELTNGNRSIESYISALFHLIFYNQFINTSVVIFRHSGIRHYGIRHSGIRHFGIRHSGTFPSVSVSFSLSQSLFSTLSFSVLLSLLVCFLLIFSVSLVLKQLCANSIIFPPLIQLMLTFMVYNNVLLIYVINYII